MVTKGNRGLVEKQKLLKSRRGEKLRKKSKTVKKSNLQGCQMSVKKLFGLWKLLCKSNQTFLISIVKYKY